MLGFAVAGVLLGHTLTYLLAIPDPLHRDLVLRTTGHAYLPAAGEAALVLLLAGVAAVVVRAWSRGRREGRDSFGGLAGLLTAVQVSGFLGQEVLERLVTRSPLGELVHDHVLAIGVLLQIPLALAAAAMLRWLARASAAVAETTGGRTATPRPALVLAATAPADVPHGRVAATARRDRAPPSA